MKYNTLKVGSSCKEGERAGMAVIEWMDGSSGRREDRSPSPPHHTITIIISIHISLFNPNFHLPISQFESNKRNRRQNVVANLRWWPFDVWHRWQWPASQLRRHYRTRRHRLGPERQVSSGHFLISPPFSFDCFELGCEIVFDFVSVWFFDVDLDDSTIYTIWLLDPLISLSYQVSTICKFDHVIIVCA